MEQKFPSRPQTIVRQSEDQHSEGPTLEKSALEGLCPVEGTRTEAVDEVVWTMRRTHVEGVHGVPIRRGTPLWGREGVWGALPMKEKELQKHDEVTTTPIPSPCTTGRVWQCKVEKFLVNSSSGRRDF